MFDSVITVFVSRSSETMLFVTDCFVVADRTVPVSERSSAMVLWFSFESLSSSNSKSKRSLSIAHSLKKNLKQTDSVNMDETKDLALHRNRQIA